MECRRARPKSRISSFRVSSEAGDRARRAGQLEHVQSRRGAVERIDVAAVVEVHVVRLDRAVALTRTVDLDARLGRVLGDLGDEARALFRLERIADVDDTHA